MARDSRVLVGRGSLLRTLLLAVVMVLTSFGLTSCGGESSSQPALGSSELQGTWTGPLGSITFNTDRTFDGHDLKLINSGCSSTSGTGTWQFLSPAGVSSLSPTLYKSGKLIGVDFAGPRSSCNFQLTTWEIDPPVGLCLYADPDSPCTSSPFRRKT